MTKFITSTSTEADSSPHIKKILSGKNVRVASAFLGTGAEHEVKKGTRLICDIGMGGTNPAVLQALSEKLGDNLRFLPNFHAKVYISEDGCVVGSSNLSSRGVGFLSQAKLIEASVYMEATEEGAGAAADWFEGIWTNAEVVSADDIAWALTTWKSNKRGAPLAQMSDAESFFDAIMEDGGIAGEWGYILTNEEFDDRLTELAKKFQSDVIVRSGREPRGKIETYSNLSNAEDLSGYYIGIHRNDSGSVKPLALKFIGNGSQSGDVISYFEIMNWSETSIPKIQTSDLKKDGGLSLALRDAETALIGRAIDVKGIRKAFPHRLW